MFRKVLIANRGAIACRIIRTLRRLGVVSVAVYSEADRHSLHVAQADEAVLIGPALAAESYVQPVVIIDAARRVSAEAIHPGYGFLSENADFADACAEAGLTFLGPTPSQIRAFGLKHTARDMAQREGVPLLLGSGLLVNESHAAAEAARCGYPVILKSTAGGGGIGMRVCRGPWELAENFATVSRLSAAYFGQAGVYLERFVERARHIEVQIFGDGIGGVIALGERDCSAQRRHQKVIEETPAPGLSREIRSRLWEIAVRLGQAVCYRSAGTVEFLYDVDGAAFYFLEVNTRLQVEHGVTEEVTGVDLVEWMVRLGAGELPPLEHLRHEPRGVSMQARIYAEDPAHDFRPSAGLLTEVRLPHGVRCESWVESGTEVTPFSDPLLAKIIVRGETREEAVMRLSEALACTRFEGLASNLDYLRRVAAEPEFRSGAVSTSFLGRVVHRPNVVEVLEAGMQTTVQDYPGRVGYWHVGVPPSGPMDPLAFRLANRLVGNADAAAALECTMTGPALVFHADAVVAITGTDMDARLDGEPCLCWTAMRVHAGSVLRLGPATGAGARAYVAVRGGFDVPEYMGSRSTFILGRFGGHAGRVLRAGDMIRWKPTDGVPTGSGPLPPSVIPRYAPQWEIGVLYGPHGAPDFFRDDDIETLFATTWKVHYNSDRTGVRLIGPKPRWARQDGGEAGLHPSNIHDNAYAIGAMDYTGDMPVLLGPDGPSLGGFVCPVVVAHAELWKMGQLRPGDLVRFRRISEPQARRMDRELEAAIASLQGSLPQPQPDAPEPAVLRQSGGTVYRASGDRYLLVEIGPHVLDLHLRFRIHAMEEALRREHLPGVIDITPGMRSLQVHYDSRLLRREALMDWLSACEAALPDLDEFSLPVRVLHLPLSWDDPATQLAIRKYTQSVRPDAPWCPSNLEFIRRINGLGSIDDVQRIVFDASYVVLGLGDVYLGAPVSTPLDPRHRLVTTKYNPARTWTPENAVGIGGAYLCVYGMEGPGGYQFVGRTLQMWNTYRTTTAFAPGAPWLLRCFDHIRFFPVSAGELLEIRDAFPYGKYRLQIESQQFNLLAYHAFLGSIAAEAARFKQTQQAAFVAERERWATAGQSAFVEPSEEMPVIEQAELPDGCEAVRSPLTASVWQVAVQVGERVRAGQKIVVLEAMKIEVAVVAPAEGIVERLHCAPGGMVTAGQNLVTLRVAL
jgi:urea carboxylase